MTHRFFIQNRPSPSISPAPLFMLSPNRQLKSEKVPELLTVRFGQSTFDAEGTEASGRFFSRRISYPDFGDSGVTIGRGYDMGRRTSRQVISELGAAGMPLDDARYLAQSAGLRQDRAREFVEQHMATAPLISLETQKRLFEEIVTPDLIKDIKRIFAKPDTVRMYGETHWEKLPQAAQELIFDLRYRGDYTPTTRRRLQPPLVSGDLRELRAVIDDTAYWRTRGVPTERIRERQRLAELL
jgi:hypothetical protein